jgi:D-arabinose 1-dehydrogenase-like Zn-dependent alcohol dehydrogenase
MGHGQSTWQRKASSHVIITNKRLTIFRDARFTVKLPDSLDFPAAACMMCAGITVYGGIKKAQVPSGGSIGIVGIGGLGHIGTQVAKAMVYRKPSSSDCLRLT